MAIADGRTSSKDGASNRQICEHLAHDGSVEVLRLICESMPDRGRKAKPISPNVVCRVAALP